MLAVIAILTLTPGEAVLTAVRRPQWCFACGAHWGIDFMLNTILFAPLGAALALARLRPLVALGIVFGATLGVEVLQLVAIPGRIASSGDLTSNTLGGALGYLLLPRFGAVVHPTARQAWTMLAGACAVPLLALAGTAWLFGPSTTGLPVWGQLAAEMGQFGRFTGTVRQATLSGLDVPNRRFPDSDVVHARLAQHDVTVRALVLPGDSLPQTLAPIVSLFDGGRHELLVLGQERTDLVFRLRRRAAAFGLRTPVARAWNAFPPAFADGASPIRLTGVIRDYAIGAWASQGDSVSARVIRFRPTHGWAYLLPFDHLYTPRAARFTMAWLALLFAPAGWFAVQAMRRSSRAAMRIVPVLVVTGTMLAGLSLLPVALGLSPGMTLEWQGALAGVAAGAVLAAGASRVLWSRAQPRHG